MVSPEATQDLYRIVAGGVGVGALIAVSIEVAAMARAYVSRPRYISPTGPHCNRPDDPAWPNYFGKQSTADLRELFAQQRSMYGRLTQGWWTRFPFVLVSAPILLVAALMLIALALVPAVALAAIVTVGGGVYWLAAIAVRLSDALLQLRGRREASCPACYAVMKRPAYACPGCSSLHRDIRAGRLGALFRTCACGRRLPTGVLRAAWQLDAVCQHCGDPVHRGAAVLRDVRVPVFGDPHAGKTRLVIAGICGMAERARRSGLELEFPDVSSQARARAGLEQIVTGSPTVGTQRELEPPLTCQLGTGMSGVLLHVFDAAGKLFRGGDGHDELRYLDFAHTLIFVVDPCSIPVFRAELTALPPAPVLSEHLERDGLRNADESYGEVISRIRANGTETKRQRLAVVVTKADVLAGAGVSPPSESEALRTWLYERGLHNVVLAAGQEFRDVRYFAVASVEPINPHPEFDAFAPFRWALENRGSKLLAEPTQHSEAVLS